MKRYMLRIRDYWNNLLDYRPVEIHDSVKGLKRLSVHYGRFISCLTITPHFKKLSLEYAIFMCGLESAYEVYGKRRLERALGR